MRALTFEVIVRVVFGVTERDRIERLRAALVTLIDSADRVPDAGAAASRARWAQPLGAIPATQACRRRPDLRGDRARRREVDLYERDDVLSLLLGARDEDGNPMTDVELRDELMTLLLAGHETTATGLAFAFDLLYREPAVLGTPARRARGRDRRLLSRRRRLGDAAAAARDRRLRADPEPAARDRRLAAAGGDPRLPGHRPRPPPPRSLPAAARASGPSASSTRAPSPTRGSRSAAASAAASAPPSRRPRWPR